MTDDTALQEQPNLGRQFEAISHAPHTATATPTHTPRYTIQAFRKVPEITVLFWIIKLLTTGMGETTSDYLVRHIEPVIAVALGGTALVVALALQFWVR